VHNFGWAVPFGIVLFIVLVGALYLWTKGQATSAPPTDQFEEPRIASYESNELPISRSTSGQTAVAWVVIAVAVVLAVWAILMRTTVATPLGDVNNLGLLANRQNLLLAAGFFGVIGVLLLLIKRQD
jgi:hypothetical protein